MPAPASCLTFVQQSLHVDEYIGESGELLLVLEQLGQVVGDGLGVVVGDVSHPHAVLAVLVRGWWVTALVTVSVYI